jgi:hypothetical protein
LLYWYENRCTKSSGRLWRTETQVLSLLALLVQKYLLYWYENRCTKSSGRLWRTETQVLSLLALLVLSLLALLVQILTEAERDAGTQFTCFTGTKVLALLVQILTEAGRDAERLREREREREREADRGRERAERELRWREMVLSLLALLTYSVTYADVC